MNTEPPWYKTAIFYQLHVKCFCDSNGDGIGDFQGLKTKLEYIQNLGCTAIWLQPFYPSPLKDDGYDIADYTDIHPDYGTLADFKDFLKEAKRRGIRVVSELVINHTSDQHQWFQRARRAPKNSVYHNYYMWSETPDKYNDARIIFKDFETSNWAWDPIAKLYYWHRFYSHQPDLNYDCPQVHREIFKLVDLWMGMGIDGMRLDAIPYLYARDGTDCENLPETHRFLKTLRAHVEKSFPGRMLLAEANQWPEEASKYFGNDDECHMAFHFPLMPRLFMSFKMEETYPIIDIAEQTPEPPPTSQWAIFLRNHDELTLEMVTDEERNYMWHVYANDPKARINLGIRRRLAPLLDNDRSKIELMHILLFSLPGSPILYYGDEIGMGDNYYLGDRNGVRTPMQWNNNRNAGFSEANPQMLYLPLIIDPEYHHEHLNVENQERNLSSLLWWMRNAISVREKSPALGIGTLKFLQPVNPKVLVILREYDGETILVIANLSRHSNQVELPLHDFIGRTPVDLFSKNRFSPIQGETYSITLGRYGYFWLKLERSPIEFIDKSNLPKLSISKKWDEILTEPTARKLLSYALEPFLYKSRWFRSKAREIRKISISDKIKIGASYLGLIEVTFSDGLAETYVLPLGVTENQAMMEQQPLAFIAEIQGPEIQKFLIDALYDEAFRNELLMFALRAKRAHGQNGVFKGTPANGLRKTWTNGDRPPSQVLSGEQTNNVVVYDNKMILKIYRLLDEGENVELPIVRYLTESYQFPNVPTYRGNIAYHKPNKEPGTIALLQEYAESSGNLWDFTLDTIRRNFEECLAKGSSEFAGSIYNEIVINLATITAEMHLALEKATDNKFKPEPFTIHYQKSLYQAMRSQLKQNFALAKKQQFKVSDECKILLEEVMGMKNTIASHFDRFMETRFNFAKIRIHGDYHLGQILRKREQLMIIDFEGEPSTTHSQRLLKNAALQDVAGMIRSFHYAIQAVLKNYPETLSIKLSPIADAWCDSIKQLYLSNYLLNIKKTTQVLVPAEEEKQILLLNTLILHKAIYELGYELQNRPDWVAIPIKGILQTQHTLIALQDSSQPE